MSYIYSSLDVNIGICLRRKIFVKTPGNFTEKNFAETHDYYNRLIVIIIIIIIYNHHIIFITIEMF